MKLLIIESPGKQKTIQKILGAEWKVAASFGHIRALEQNVKFITKNFEPSYEFLKEKAEVIKKLKEESKGHDVYLGADKDYEGEQIAYSVCLLLKLNPDTAKRVIFTEITEKAIKTAIENPGIIDMNRVNTQKTRAMLDIMLGFTMSPLLWKHVGPSLSAGRCQTPALRLIVEREESIRTFKSSSSWEISGNWTKNGFHFAAHMEELEDEESVLNYMESVFQEGIIQSKDVKPWTENPPEPLITSTLQQQASAMYSINPKETMRIAQRLYEAGHITYMRTDKAILSEDATKEAQEWVLKQHGEEFVNKKPKICEVKGQEAHEAIRPTHMDVTSIESDPLDKKIYHLIWQRAIQSVMSAAKGETCTIIINLNDCDWTSKWKRTIFEGWKRAGKIEEKEDKEDKEVWTQAIELKIGDKVKWVDMKGEPKDTKAQGRFTEATLVRELEKFGIGRPSTFASLIATIQDKKYVEIKDIPAKEVTVKEYSLKPLEKPVEQIVKKKVGAEKRKLVPTELGQSVLVFMLQHFNDLFDYGFTEHMEKRLDLVAEGKENGKQVLEDMWESYKVRYKELSKHTEIKTKVKEFNGIKAVQSKKGPILLIEDPTQFLGWPEGVTFEEMTEEIALKHKESGKIGEWNGQPIIKKSGKFGPYLQCGNISIPYKEDMDIIEKFKEKMNPKEYIIRTGKYGPYIIKTSLKKPQFVSVPKDIDISKITDKEIEAIYKLGVESKKINKYGRAT